MLNEQKCEACSIDAIALSKEEQQSLLLQLSDCRSLREMRFLNLRRSTSLRTSNKRGRLATGLPSLQKMNSITHLSC